MEIYRSGLRLSPSRARLKPSGDITLKNIVPYVGMKSVLFQFLHRGVSLPQMYQVDVFLSPVEFVQQDPSDIGAYMKIQYKDLKTWLKKIDLNTTSVRLRCACPDEYFVWSYYRWQNACLFGSKPRTYIRKTLTYPSRNPNHYVGACKHSLRSISYLVHAGWTVPITLPWV